MATKVKFPLKGKKGGQKKEWKELYLDSLREFASGLILIQDTLDFQMSARGWCYVLEPQGLSKGDFDWMQKQIREARIQGFLEPGFILEEEGHKVKSEEDTEWSVTDFFNASYRRYRDAEENFRSSYGDYDEGYLSFWKGQKYFIQLLVEKSDLKSLFMDICRRYKIPMANMRGWGSMEQKAEMAKNFRRAEENGQTPVLLACCDFDPPGLSISGILKKTFEEYSLFSGWDPDNLIVDRIGLDYNFIKKNKLSWIEGLTTISGKDLADKNHTFWKNNIYDVQGYVKKYGKRKCEANAIVVAPKLGRQLLENYIEKYLGKDVHEKYWDKIMKRRKEIEALIEEKIKEVE